MIIKTFCARMDHGGCGLLAHIQDGKIIKIEGDPECPLNRGAICAKGRAQIERLYHPDRLRYPLQRIGARGEGRWQRISWAEALTTIAEKIKEKIDQGEERSIVFAQGTPKGLELYLLIRLANVLKISHLITPGSICHMPRETGAFYTCGFFPVPDFDHPPNLVLVWGSNLYQTNEEGIMGAQLRRVRDKGAKLIVIDPRKTPLAAHADLWLRIKPGTDLALALGILKIIIEEDLVDREFVEKWTSGYQELKESLKNYSLPEISKMTWIPEKEIKEAARLYGLTKPACIQWGNALEHTINSVQCARALVILEALTGNLDRPGGNVHRPGPPVLRPGEFVLSSKFREKRERLLAPGMRLAAQMGFTPSQVIIKAILDEQPYPLKVMYVQGGNPLLSYAQAQETYQALKKLEFLAVAEIFLTPTAQLADIVLPVATNFEFDDLGHYGLPHGFILARPKLVEPLDECWPDSMIINELAKRLGQEKFFWPNLRACLDDILKPAGLNYDELKKIGYFKGDWVYRKYEEKGFPTPSGKVEIYSSKFAEWGYDPLPTYREPVTTSSDSKYPLILTSAKDAYYFHSAYRNISSLRRLSPDPKLFIHPQTAQELGIHEGEWVVIETGQGTIRQKAAFDENLHPQVVVGAYGWWFPERQDLELSGWKEANINILTDNSPPYEPTIGSTNLRAIPCRVYREN
ncbi:MAG: molybdopterin-containing oxidoreductase family protein [Thermodesulfobacteriota bacterium]